MDDHAGECRGCGASSSGFGHEGKYCLSCKLKQDRETRTFAAREKEASSPRLARTHPRVYSS